MSTTWSRILKIIVAVVIGAGLVAVGFLLGRGNELTGFLPGARSRFGVPGFGFGLGSGFWIILNILFWALIVGSIVWLVSGLVSGRRPSHVSSGTVAPPESVLDILNKRYARGEITKAQYDELRHDLGT
jgi:putative membrane protein